jgi:hypothetical protein
MPSRAEVVARIRTVWGMGTVPYSMTSTASPSGHRCDCSGYASAVWGLPVPGLSTVTLVTAGAMFELEDLDQLLPGDALAIAGPGTEGANGHIQIFESWNDDNTMTIVEQSGGRNGPTASRIHGPGAGFRPYRLATIHEGEDEVTPADITAFWARLDEDSPEGDAARAAVGRAVWNFIYAMPPDFPNPYGFSQGQIQHGTNKASFDTLNAVKALPPPAAPTGVAPHQHWMPEPPEDLPDTTGGVAYS